MSNFPGWWDTTITVYNKYEDPQTNIIRWYKTVLHNCFWKYSNNKVIFNEVILESNDIICRIPKDDRFLPKHKWLELPNDEKSKFFTLGVNDLIIKDECSEEVDEYKSGIRSSDLIKKYKSLQGCMIIEAMSDNTGNCRNNRHYLVKGI